MVVLHDHFVLRTGDLHSFFGGCTRANTLLTDCVIIEDIRYLCFDVRFWFWFGGLMNTDFDYAPLPKRRWSDVERRLVMRCCA